MKFRRNKKQALPPALIPFTLDEKEELVQRVQEGTKSVDESRAELGLAPWELPGTSIPVPASISEPEPESELIPALRDWRWSPITEGTHVVYMAGSYLKEGKVTSVGPDYIEVIFVRASDGSKDSQPDLPRKLSRLDRVVVVAE